MVAFRAEVDDVHQRSGSGSRRLGTLAVGLVLAVLLGRADSAATEIPLFATSVEPQEIVFFLGVTDFTASQTRSMTVYGDGVVLLHVDTEKEVLKETARQIDPAELEAVLESAAQGGLGNWHTEAMGRRADALGYRLLGSEAGKTRTRVLWAIDSKAEHAFTLDDSRALAVAFPDIAEYSTVIGLEDWMESLWLRPPVDAAAHFREAAGLVVPAGGEDLVLRVESKSGQSLHHAVLSFFGDGGVLLETRQPSGETVRSRKGRLAPAELTELQSLLRRLADFDPRSVQVQIFRKSGRSVFHLPSDGGPQTFEVHLRDAAGKPVVRRFESAGSGAANRYPSIQELADLKRVWELAFGSFGAAD